MGLELKNIKNIILKYKLNFYFYIYIILTLLIWKKIIIVLVFLNILAILKFVKLSRNTEITLYSHKILDNLIYKILVCFKTKKNLNYYLVLLVEVFFRYIIIFLTSVSLKSLVWMLEFFDEYNMWETSYISHKIKHIDKFCIYFFKKKMIIQMFDMDISFIKINKKIRISYL